MAAAGPLRALTREAVRRRLEPDTLSAAQNDALLHPYGVKVVHFPYPQYFETRLPMGDCRIETCRRPFSRASRPGSTT